MPKVKAKQPRTIAYTVRELVRALSRVKDPAARVLFMYGGELHPVCVIDATHVRKSVVLIDDVEADYAD